jgi:ankyrin repeat protein
MSLLSLPTELLLQIVGYLKKGCDINSLVQTCRAFWRSFSQELYVFDARHRDSKAFFWGMDNGVVPTMRRSILASRGTPDSFCLDDIDGKIARIVERGHVSMASYWLGHGASANTLATIYWGRGKQKIPDRPLLHVAIDLRNAKMVKILLQKGALPNETYRGKPPLYRATRKGRRRTGIVRLLLDAGADVHYTSPNGHTVLHSAAVGCDPKTMELLLDHGADLNAKNNFGQTAIDRAFFCGNFEVIEYILDRKCSLTTNDEVSYQTELISNERLLCLLCASGYDLNQHYGAVSNTLLHHAADKNNVKWVELLLRWGVDVDACTTFGDTPLHLAVRHRKVKVARMLLEHGANVNRLQKQRGTPLHIAVRSRRLETIKLLIAKGACLEKKDSNSHTPLMIAVKKNYKQGKEILTTIGWLSNHSY